MNYPLFLRWLYSSGIVRNVAKALKYRGTWNANTNTPTLASGVGTLGDFYLVSVAGTTSIDGINDWHVGDSLYFNGSVWQHVDGSSEQVFDYLRCNGNMGINCDPSAWESDIRAIEFFESSAGQAAFGVGQGSGAFSLTNAYLDATNTWRYKANGEAFYEGHFLSGFTNLYAPAGTAGAAIPWQVLTGFNSFGDSLAQRYAIQYQTRKTPIIAGNVNGVSLVVVAATFVGAYTVTDNGSGLTKIASTGAHGLTAAVAVGKSIGIVSGTGWTANSLAKVTALDVDTTGVEITVDVPFTSQGSPTIALAGTTAQLGALTVPGGSLGDTGLLRSTHALSIKPGAGNGSIIHQFGGTQVYGTISTATAVSVYTEGMCWNTTAATQKFPTPFSNSLTSIVATPDALYSTAAIDTTVDQEYTIHGLLDTANAYVSYEYFNLVIEP